VWENCAKIVCNQTDEALSPYLIPMLEWLQDFNWPGSFLILERLKKYRDIRTLSNALDKCINRAVAIKDEPWLTNLSAFLDCIELMKELKQEHFNLLNASVPGWKKEAEGKGK